MSRCLNGFLPIHSQTVDILKIRVYNLVIIIKEDEAMKFEFTPLMYWQDITYLLQKLAGLFKKLFEKIGQK